jgi:hypothetical protein
VTSVRLAGSTEVTLPPFDSDTHSSEGRVELLPAAWNRRCFEKLSLASSTISFDRGFAVFR